MDFLGTFNDYINRICLLRKVVVNLGRRGEMFPFLLNKNLMKVFQRKQKSYRLNRQALNSPISSSFLRYLMLGLLSVATMLFAWFWRTKKTGTLRQSYKCKEK
jgi:hypothetical protein